jgi:hypothetical protein
MTHTYIEYALMAYLEDAYQLLRHGKYSSVVIHRPMVVIVEPSTLMQRCGEVTSTGLPCMMTPSHLFDDAADVRSTGTSMQGMQCP